MSYLLLYEWLIVVLLPLMHNKCLPRRTKLGDRFFVTLVVLRTLACLYTNIPMNLKRVEISVSINVCWKSRSYEIRNPYNIFIPSDFHSSLRPWIYSFPESKSEVDPRSSHPPSNLPVKVLN